MQKTVVMLDCCIEDSRERTGKQMYRIKATTSVRVPDLAPPTATRTRRLSHYAHKLSLTSTGTSVAEEGVLSEGHLALSGFPDQTRGSLSWPHCYRRDDCSPLNAASLFHSSFIWTSVLHLTADAFCHLEPMTVVQTPRFLLLFDPKSLSLIF